MHPARGCAASLLLLCAGLLLGAGCSDRDVVTPDPNGPQPHWELGPSADHPVSSVPGSVVADSATGAVFRFPDGGSGTLRAAPILSGPTPPFDGAGLSVEYAGGEVVQLLVDPAGAGRVYVFGYGLPDGAHNEPAGSPRWISVPQVDTLEGKVACLLTLPFAGGKGAFGGPAAGHARIPPGARATGTGAAAPAGAGGVVAPALASLRADQPRGFDKYWISSIPPGATVTDTMLAIELQASTFRDNLLAALAPARRAAAEAEIKGRLSPHYAFDGNYYSGFWWRSLGAHGRLVHPTLHYKKTANAGNIAHELGHYFTHVLVGDDTWSTLEGQAPLWDTGHGIRDVQGRGTVLEEYAYLPEFHLVGSVKGYDLFQPYDIFRDMTPLGTDFPAVEGFGAVILAALARPDAEVRDLTTGRPVPAPVLDLPWSDLYEIVAEGATDIDALRAEIEARLGADADKLPALLGRCGWTYSVRGRYVDPAGGGVPGVTTTAVSRVGGTVYAGGYTTLPSKADGAFSVVGGVFGGPSELRAVKGPDTAFVAIRVDWTRPTSTTVELGNLPLSFPPVITGFSVASGRPGDAVTIAGRNFGPAQNGGVVAFNGVAAAVTSWSDGAIAVTVPVGAHTGPVTVTRGGVASNGLEFVVTGVGRWVHYDTEVTDWLPSPPSWMNFYEYQFQEGSFTLRNGFDNPNFAEQHPMDWETRVSGTWTTPPAELFPGTELSITLTITTQYVVVDDPPERSGSSAGFISVSGNLDDQPAPPTLTGNGTQIRTFVVRDVGWQPELDRLALDVFGGGQTGAGAVRRRYWYSWQE